MINRFIRSRYKFFFTISFYSLFLIYLVPFAKKINFNFETFPAIALFLSLLIILFFKDLIIDKNNKIIFLLMLSFIFIFVIQIFYIKNVSYVTLLKVLICPIIFLTSNIILKNVSFKNICLVVFSLIGLFLIFKLKPPYIFEISCNSISFFIGRLDCTNLSNLQKPFLITPEPSYLSMMSFFLIIIIEFLYLKNAKRKKLNYYIKCTSLQILLLFLMIQTDSRSIYVFIIPFILTKILAINKKFFPIIIIFLVTIFSATNVSRINNVFDDARIILQDITLNKNENVRKNPQSIDKYNSFMYFLATANHLEPTGMLRVNLNLLSINGFLNSNIFLGNGSGSFKDNWQVYADKTKLTKIMKNENEVIKKWDNYYDKEQSPQNYFFLVLHDFGIIPIFIILLLLLKSVKNFDKKTITIDLPILFFVIYCFFYQGQITNPHHWIILSLMLNKNSLLNEKK